MVWLREKIRAIRKYRIALKKREKEWMFGRSGAQSRYQYQYGMPSVCPSQEAGALQGSSLASFLPTLTQPVAAATMIVVRMMRESLMCANVPAAIKDFG